MDDNTLISLSNFIEQTNRLRDYQFYEHVRETGLGFNITSINDDLYEIEFGLPDEKERDAFLLPFRMFYQYRDCISISKLEELLEDPNLSDEWKEKYLEIKSKYDEYLSGYPDSIEDLYGTRPKRKEILDTVLYGSLAHLSEDSRKRYLNMTSDEIRANVLLQEFTIIILQIFIFIDALSRECERELAKHK